MHTEGIDKITLATKEFKVLEGHKLTIQPMAYQPNSPNPVEEPLLFGNQKGSKAYFNHKNFNVSINQKGLSIAFNPSKALHPYNLTNSDNEIQQVWDFCRDELKEGGVLIPSDNELKIVRLDMAMNKQMAFPIQFYAPVFQSLKGKRMNNKAFPSSHYFSNDSREINFYDKTEEVNQREESIEIDPRIMRAELRAKKSDSVARIFRFNDMSTLLNVGGEYRIEKYKRTMISQIFAEGNRADQLAIFSLDYDRELEILKKYKDTYSRNSIHIWLADNGIQTIIDKFGNLINLRLCLLDAGYQAKFTFRVIKDLKERLQMASFYQTENKEQNLSNLYNEVYTKFAV